MRINNAIVLAGGLGTRLKSVIQDIPKPMAPVCDKPFLKHILDYLYNYGFKRVVLSVGYRREVVQEFFNDNYRGITIEYAIENEPMGTGGGIKLAAEKFKEEPFFVFNGDTMFHADLWEMEHTFFNAKPKIVMALKPMKNFSRYGTVELNDVNNIISFNEKSYKKEGIINGGVYLFDNSLFELEKFPNKFSFEKDIMEKYVAEINMKGIVFDGYFIDIGIPEDYQQAEIDFKPYTLTELKRKINTENWTLFLDRDGVINKRIPGNYVKFPKEFEFIEDSDTACGIFSKLFKTIVVVTNQQGVGKSLMREEWLEDVHAYMQEGIEKKGGSIDKCYYCPELAKNNPKGRKPNIGMGLDAKNDFPHIDFSKSILVGDSISDIQFGNRLGMVTVFVETKTPEEVELAKKENIDFQFENLYEFAKVLID